MIVEITKKIHLGELKPSEDVAEIAKNFHK